MNVAVGAKTDVGRIREVNEDSYLVHEPLFAVADGMGGHIAGDVASSTAVELIEEQSDTASAEDMESLARLVRNANSRIWERAQADPSLHGMGTTCTLMLLDGAQAHIAHVGDSRAYLLRDGKLTQLTEDHSLVGRMVKEGRLRPEEAEHHPQRSIVTRALGVDSSVEVDLLSVDLNDGDRLLLCSDGLNSMTENSAIREVLESSDDPQTAADRLIELANDAGGEDNITVVVLDLGAEGAQNAASSTNQTTPTARRSGAVGGGGAAVAGSVTAQQAGVPRSSSVTVAQHAPSASPGTPVAVREDDRAPERDSREWDDDGAGEQVEPAAPTWPRKLAVGLLVLVVLGAGAFFAARYVLQNSWYIGVNGDNKVAVYQGIPEEIVGFTFREQKRVSDLSLDQLPQFLRDGPKKGIKVDSFEQALGKIEDLRSQALPEGGKDGPQAQPKDTQDNNDTNNDKKKG